MNIYLIWRELLKYVNFGLSSMKVSKIALGLGFRGQYDPAEGIKVINTAIDNGINIIDCANVYGFGDDRKNIGKSEELLGRVIKHSRDSLVITSKVSSEMGDGPNDYGGSRYHIINQCEKSLSRLETDRIDVYLLHAINPDSGMEEQFRALEHLINQGKILYVGVCNYQAWEIIKAMGVQTSIGAQPLITAQNPYNLLNRQIELEMFPMARDTNVGIMAYSPLGVGLLSGDYIPGEPPPKGSLWATIRKNYFEKYMKGYVSDTILKLKEISKELNLTMSQVAIAWVLSHDEITLAISGSDTVSQIKEVSKATEIVLSKEHLNQLNFVSRKLTLDLDTYLGEGDFGDD